MTSILRSDATSALGFTLGFVIGFSFFGSPASSAGEDPSPAEEMLQADHRSRPSNGLSGRSDWGGQKTVAHHAHTVGRSQTRR